MDYANNSGPGFLFYFLFSVVFFLFIAFEIICLWRIFVKAGKPGWAAIVPIYNILVELEILGRPWWWLFIMMIPLVNFVVGLSIIFDLAQVFGNSSAFALGLLFLSPIFIAILAFGSAKYIGPVAAVQPTVYTPPYTPPPAPPVPPAA